MSSGWPSPSRASEPPRLPRPPHDHQIQTTVEATQHEQQQAIHTRHAAAVARAAPQNQPRSLWMEFLLGGSATMTACLFTNPIEVVKTRMQVQGELARSSGNTAVRPYKTMFHAFYTIAKNEGLRGLQGGLGPAALYQLAMNGTRLGLYAPLQRFYSSCLGDEKRSPLEGPRVLTNVLAGSSSGLIAAVAGSPFFMMKVRLQVQNKSLTAASVGHQHAYRGAWSGLYQVAKTEGIRGLYRGVQGSMLRVGVGSGVQLSTYDGCKHFVLTHGFQEGVRAHFAASLISGFLVTIAMNPFDVISTRLYNQPVQHGKGMLYSSIADCFGKTIQTEGISALYKGFWAHYFRLGPHTILTFVFWEQTKSLATKWGI